LREYFLNSYKTPEKHLGNFRITIFAETRYCDLANINLRCKIRSRVSVSENIAKGLAAFERIVLGRMFGGIKANEIWRKRHNKELMQLFGVLPFVRVRRLNWTGYVNRIDCKRKVSQAYNSNPQGSRLRGRPKNRWWNCVQTGINK
jgi:hypothetical protein